MIAKCPGDAQSARFCVRPAATAGAVGLDRAEVVGKGCVAQVEDSVAGYCVAEALEFLVYTLYIYMCV